MQGLQVYRSQLRVGDVHVYKSGRLLYKGSLFGQKRPCHVELRGTKLTLRIDELSKTKICNIERARLAKQSSRLRMVLILSTREKVSLYATDSEELESWIQVLADSIQWKIQRFYDIGKEIGHGGFATVRKGKRKRTGEHVAIKVIDKEAIGQEDIKYMQREVDIAQSVCHVNVVRSQDIFDSLGKLYIVLEYMPGGTLQNFVDRNGRQSEGDARAIMRDLLTAVEYVHQKKIVHRDIKPENIMCTRSSLPMTVKIMDFGLSRHIRENNNCSSQERTSQRDSGLGPDGLMTTPVGTPTFVAPEILMGLPYGKEVDIFASGVILYWLLSGNLPFDHPDPQQLMQLIKKTEFSFPAKQWKYVSSPAVDLIRRMLDRSPYVRITASEALSHIWMTFQDDEAPTTRKAVGFLSQVEVFSARAELHSEENHDPNANGKQNGGLDEMTSPVSVLSSGL